MKTTQTHRIASRNMRHARLCHHSIALAAMLSLFASPMARGALIITYSEDSNSYVSSISNTTVLNFNSIAADSTASNLAWTSISGTIGTIDHVHVLAADVYGGAGTSGSNYAVQSQSLSATPTTTITFVTNHAYFGFWWSAGDAHNVLSFYSGPSLIAQVTTLTLLNKLAASPDYYGNPRTGQNLTEAYAFINFFGMEGTTWDSITLSNQGASGFESDNWTDRITPWGSQPGEEGPLPGIPVASVSGTTVTVIPETSPMLGLMVELMLLAFHRRL